MKRKIKKRIGLVAPLDAAGNEMLPGGGESTLYTNGGGGTTPLNVQDPIIDYSTPQDNLIVEQPAPQLVPQLIPGPGEAPAPQVIPTTEKKINWTLLIVVAIAIYYLNKKS